MWKTILTCNKLLRNKEIKKNKPEAAGSAPAKSQTYNLPALRTPLFVGCGISASKTKIQWPRVEAGLYCVGAIAFFPLAILKIVINSFHVVTVCFQKFQKK